MGLDQYLSASFASYGGYKHVRENPAFATETKLYDAVIAALGIERSPDMNSISVSVQVGYWRKANHIHKWFIDRCGGGDPDCCKMDVSRDDLVALRDLCLRVKSAAKMEDSSVIEPGKVIANAKEIAALLPTQSGFFFGSTDYDEYYMADIEHTLEMLGRVLDDPKYKDCEFTYRASW